MSMHPSLFDEEQSSEDKNAGDKGAELKQEQRPVKSDTKADLLEGWEANKQYYSIGEVAALFGINTSNIRFWTKEFEMKVRTTRKGDRLYTPEQIKELRIIYHLVKEKGYTIAGARARMKADRKGNASTIDLKQSLLELRNKLILIRNQLT